MDVFHWRSTPHGETAPWVLCRVESSQRRCTTSPLDSPLTCCRICGVACLCRVLRGSCSEQDTSPPVTLCLQQKLWRRAPCREAVTQLLQQAPRPQLPFLLLLFRALAEQYISQRLSGSLPLLGEGGKLVDYCSTSKAAIISTLSWEKALLATLGFISE